MRLNCTLYMVAGLLISVDNRATILLNRLVEDPKRFFPYARLYASSVAAVLAWGFRAKTLDSFWFKDVSEMIEEVLWLINLCKLND